MKPARRRAQARTDILDTARHYREAAGAAIAQRFAQAVKAAVAQLGANPAIGSPRIGLDELQLCIARGGRWHRWVPSIGAAKADRIATSHSPEWPPSPPRPCPLVSSARLRLRKVANQVLLCPAD